MKAAENRQQFVVELAGNLSTGYVWKYTVSEEGIVSVSENSEYTGSPGMTGVSSVFTYTFTPVREGTVSVVFMYSRPWQMEISADSVTYEISVGKNGSICAEKR